MNKIVISSLIFVSLLIPSLSVLRAQTVDTPATYAQVNDLKTTLIALLTQLIAQLQSQISDLVAQQSLATTSPVIEPVQTVLGSVSPAYSFTPEIAFGGTSSSTTGQVHITMPSDMTEGYISLYDNGARTKLHTGVNDFSGFIQCVQERIKTVDCKKQTYNWTINARSADTDFSTTTGSFLGSDAWVVKEQ